MQVSLVIELVAGAPGLSVALRRTRARGQAVADHGEGPPHRSHDAELQRRLWAVSEELTGVSYPI